MDEADDDDWLIISASSDQPAEVAPNLFMGSLPRSLAEKFKFVVNLANAPQQSAFRCAYGLPEDTIVMHVGIEDTNRVPDVAILEATAAAINLFRGYGPVLVHCHAGLNRSGLICALALIRDGHSPENAIAQVRNARGDYALCNDFFVAWLMQLSTEA